MRIVRNIIQIAILLFLICSVNYGCKKWLDKNPSTNVGLPEDLKDLQALLDNVEEVNEYLTPSMIEASADDYFVLQSLIDQYAGNPKYIAPYTWGIDPFNSSSDWRSCNSPIYIANLCLDQLSKITKNGSNEALWNNIKGSSLFVRSYYSLMLGWTYCKAFDSLTANTDLGIVLRMTSDITDQNLVRSNVKDSYSQIINDAKEASSYLPDLSIHCLRPSKASAYGLLARIYLSMRDYENALKYANESLQLFNLLMDYNGDPDITGPLTGETTPFKKYNKEILFYSSMNANCITQIPRFAKIDSILIDSFSNSDLRKVAYFKKNNQYYSFKGSYSTQLDYLFTGIATDEIILIKAECEARIGGIDRSGNKEAAMNELNGLLKMRYKRDSFHPYVAVNSKEALDIILKERRKELIMRGLRWSDIKRFNKEGANITLKRNINGQVYLLMPNENRYAQPIPEEVIIRTGILQNPR